jgi:hypothetical protein
MASRVHRPLKIIAFNANGIGRQRHELSKQLQDCHRKHKRLKLGGGKAYDRSSV